MGGRIKALALGRADPMDRGAFPHRETILMQVEVTLDGLVLQETDLFQTPDPTSVDPRLSLSQGKLKILFRNSNNNDKDNDNNKHMNNDNNKNMNNDNNKNMNKDSMNNNNMNIEQQQQQ